MELTTILASSVIAAMISAAVSYYSNKKKQNTEIYDRIVPMFVEMKGRLHKIKEPNHPTDLTESNAIDYMTDLMERCFLYKKETQDMYLFYRPYFPEKSKIRINEALAILEKFEKTYLGLMGEEGNEIPSSIKIKDFADPFISYLNIDSAPYLNINFLIDLRIRLHLNVGKVMYDEIDAIIKHFYGNLLTQRM